MKTPILIAALVSFTLSHPLYSATYSWNAASGLFPNQVTPAMTLDNSASPENPALASGVLTIATDSFPEAMTYDSRGADLSVPSHLTISAEMRFVSGSTAFTSRSGASIQFVTAPGAGNILFFEADSIFLLADQNTRGPSAAIDTDDAFHSYRVEVFGTSGGSSVQVFQDEVLRLSGSLFSDVDLVNPSVQFGDTTGGAAAISEWKSFSHNAAVPEPTSATLLAAGSALVLLRRRKRCETH